MRKLMMLLLPFLLISCSGTKEKPALNKQQIAPVVYALMIADEVTLQKSYKDSTKTLKQMRAEQYEKVFALYNTNRAEFWNSFRYYEARPGEL